MAKTLAKEEKSELVKAELLKLIESERAEEGCINYDLRQDNENKTSFCSMKTTRIVAFGKNTWAISIYKTL